MTTTIPEYKVIREAIPKEYIEEIIKRIKDGGFIEPHPFTNFEGIVIDYSAIDPESKIQDIIKYAEEYFTEKYVTKERGMVLSRSYGTIMHKGALLEPHKDLYDSGREHDFSYGDALVCNIYLSECDGGELRFAEIGVELKLNAGDVVLFPGYLLNHSVNTVRDGDRVTILNHFSLLSEEDTKQIDLIKNKIKK